MNRGIFIPGNYEVESIGSSYRLTTPDNGLITVKSLDELYCLVKLIPKGSYVEGMPVQQSSFATAHPISPVQPEWQDYGMTVIKDLDKVLAPKGKPESTMGLRLLIDKWTSERAKKRSSEKSSKN